MTGRVINREELAWAAGFFDGEGCTVLQRSKKHPRTYLYTSLTQVNLEPLKRFHNAVGGLGVIYGPYTHGRGRNWAPIHKWHTNKFEHSQAVLAMLWSFLSAPKRAQASAALREVRLSPRRHWQRKGL